MAYNQSDDEDDNGFLGTPFAPLDTNQIVSRKPDLDLTVRDSKGRRRFHGAFTGGFSAGHFMTVGSEEGFTPQQYVSNRQQRWDQSLVQRKPENFMDSEDLDVFGIAPKKIATKEKFVTEEEFAGFRKTDSLIDVLKTVIKPTNESIGRQLFKRMKLNARKDKYLETKVYGCEVSTNRGDNHFSLASYKPKSDFHGIGYKSISEENDCLDSKSSNGVVSAIFKSGRKLQISGEAFGYGVLDEDIEEDAVVYHKEDLSQYDFEIGSIKPQSKLKNKNKSNDVLKSDLIEGFTKSFTKINLSENIQNKYPIPVIPKDWKRTSVHHKHRKSRWDQSSDAFKVSGTIDDQNVISKTPVLNANIRAVLLGEEVIHRQGVKKPVLDPAKKEPTLLFSDNTIKESSDEKPIFVEKPLFGFWANKFTRSSQGPEESTLSVGLTQFKSTQKETNIENELNQNETNNKVERTTYEWHPHTLLCKRFNIPNPFPQYPDFVGVVTVGRSDVRNRTAIISDKKVKPNIFGSLFSEEGLSAVTRTKSVETDSKSVTNISEVKDNENNSDEENEDPTRPPMDLFKAIFASDEESDAEYNTMIDKTDQFKQTLDNNDSNNEKNNSNESKTTELSANKGRGIFANIDFDELNRDFTPLLNTNETQKSETNNLQNEKNLIPNVDQNMSKSSEPEDDFYGPALPPESSVSNLNVSHNLDVTEVKSKPSKRKKRAKKQKKHKKQKTTHKKHKQRKSSDSDSSSDSIIELKILQKLKSARK